MIKYKEYEFHSKLVAEVKKHPCLYDTQPHLAADAADSWQAVALAVNCDVKRCKTHWFMVRQRLRDAMNDKLPTKFWILFDEMEFVKPFIKPTDNVYQKFRSRNTFDQEEINLRVKLIWEVKFRPEIYTGNATEDNVYEAWETISRKISIPALILKEKWSKIVRNFKAYIKNKRPSKMDTYYQTLEFLVPYLKESDEAKATHDSEDPEDLIVLDSEDESCFVVSNDEHSQSSNSEQDSNDDKNDESPEITIEENVIMKVEDENDAETEQGCNIDDVVAENQPIPNFDKKTEEATCVYNDDNQNEVAILKTDVKQESCETPKELYLDENIIVVFEKTAGSGNPEDVYCIIKTVDAKTYSISNEEESIYGHIYKYTGYDNINAFISIFPNEKYSIENILRDEEDDEELEDYFGINTIHKSKNNNDSYDGKEIRDRKKFLLSLSEYMLKMDDLSKMNFQNNVLNLVDEIMNDNS